MAARLTLKRLDREGLGPGTYHIKPAMTSPMCSLGSRFDSDVRSKDHLHPKKKDGPGPGSYDLPSSVKVATQLKNPTFGKAQRDWSDLAKESPAPNQYKHINKHTETAYAFSIPKASKANEDAMYKASLQPGPGAYKINRDMNGGLAKSILGGADSKKDVDNGVPGPGGYNAKEIYHPPGFRIVDHKNSSLLKQGMEELNGDRADPVGPQRYSPNYPTHV